MKETTPLVAGAAQMADEMTRIYSAASSISAGHVKHADFSYKDSSIFLNIQPCLDWDGLTKELKRAFRIEENEAVNIYRKRKDGKLCEILDISGIEVKEEYYVKTGESVQILPFSPEMEEFFEKLKTDRNRPESDIITLKRIFTEQGILFDDLMETDGDLAITEGKLERIGIVQLGLRTSILAIIKKYSIK